jgi:hypothetical protein
MKIKVCIPHYFSSSFNEDFYKSIGWSHGSLDGKIEKRKNAFDRCLWSLIHLANENNDGLLNIPHRKVDKLLIIKKNYDISITVVTDGKNICDEILNKYKDYAKVKEVELNTSMDLVFEAREELFQYEDYDLYFYCEDDIGISDKKFFNKIQWFAEQTNHQGVLMPHRFENLYSLEIEKIYIDGPIDQNLLKNFMIARNNSLSLNYKNNTLIFDNPINPHSGTFCLTKNQRDYIINKGIQRRSDFVSSLESVATLTAMEFFDIYKPSFKYRKFLEVEHLCTRYNIHEK